MTVPSVERSFENRLSALRERELVDAAQRGDGAAAEELINSTRAWVGKLASEYANKRVGCDDLLQVGLLEGWLAVKRLNPRQGVRLITYAWPSVEGAIRRASRSQHVVSVTTREAGTIAKVAAIRHRLRQELGREPREDEVADAAGISVAELVGLARVAESVLGLEELDEDEEVTDGSELDEGGGVYSDAEVRKLVHAYQVLRARLDGSRAEGKPQPSPSMRPGTFVHLRLLDLERALEHLPEDEYEVLRAVGLERQSKVDAAARLGIAERTVYLRYDRAIRFLSEYMNGRRDGPRFRSFRLALDMHPLEALARCVERHQAFFDELARQAASDPRFKDVQVRWLPAKNSCAPVMHTDRADIALPLSRLARSA